MKQSYGLQPSLKQVVRLNSSLIHQLSVLESSQAELMRDISQMVRENPFLSCKDPGLFEEESWDLYEGNSPKNLKQELYEQLHTSSCLYDERICSYIIESLDHHGFFTTSIQEAAADLQVPEAQVRNALSMIQNLDPSGVAAADCVDSLILQLKRKKEDLAVVLLQEHGADLENGRIQKICKDLQITREEYEDLLARIQECSPYPCQEYDTNSSGTVYIKPDLSIRVIDDEIQIENNFQPDLEVSSLDSSDLSDEMKAFLQQAHFFADSITKRSQTLLLLANELVSWQKSWFLYRGELKPCTQQQLAQRTGLHVSTVSRTLKHKYFEFESVVYPLSSLLSTKTRSGSSRDEVCKAIQYYIAREEPQDPYYDEDLEQLMKEDDIFASRRTIAKYRKALGIPGSRKRKKAVR